MSFFWVNDECNGCLACVQNCPAGALQYIDEGDERILKHNITRCARCAHCWRICPRKAIEFDHLLKSGWDEVISLKLIHCKVCGEPLYTARFGETLDKDYDDEIEQLCPDHRKGTIVHSWKHKMNIRNKAEAAEE